MTHRLRMCALVLASALAGSGCEDPAPGRPSADLVPPAAVALNQGAVTTSTVTLAWTAPGDDGRLGTATAYDLRYATTPVTLSNWDAATSVAGEPAPAPAGSAESFTVTDLTIGTSYHFALRTGDEAGNWSELSDALAVATVPAPDVVAPAAVADLAVRSSTTVSLTLAWTAPGDDDATGTATAYDVRYAAEPITESNWDAALPAAGEPAPATSGTAATCLVAGLGEATTWHLALRSRDEAGNWSALSNVVAASTDTFSLGALVELPAGTFTMGSPADEPRREPGEAAHTVTLTRAFRLQATELTSRQYRDLAQWAYDHGHLAVTDDGLVDLLDGSNALLRSCGLYHLQIDDGVFQCRSAASPVWNMSWHEAAACCDWLNLRLGLPRTYNHATWQCLGAGPYGAVGYRLPTEAEWEYACRAGSSAAFANGPFTQPDCSPLDTGLDALGWYCGNLGSHAGPLPVGRKQPNSWGLYDMHGNVSELCHDWAGPYDGPATDPVGVPAAGAHVVRGGNAYSGAQGCRAAARAWESAGLVGFRMARTAVTDGTH